MNDLIWRVPAFAHQMLWHKRANGRRFPQRTFPLWLRKQTSSEVTGGLRRRQRQRSIRQARNATYGCERDGM